ncbi:hypothetical protein OYT88_02135 [Sporolactobacillus sp. CQH2019]|uniref:hypothetical protein n=1 Tax=Sporolactobacillus sp. CQH2019 TaxID=3023512 RepID=UPI002367CA61|nr:hypothetical protein [Sporolactobacillus sp. CQH2019]MDD9147348.1 hypothetical protein [Sporolactobacillus sp. CQH2019]
MLQSQEVQQALRSLPQLTAIVPADHICAYVIKKEFQKQMDQPVILVTDVRGLYNKFASNHAYGAYRTVQIQGWFDPSDARADRVRRLVNYGAETVGYYNTYDGGFVADPVTNELFFTCQYTKSSAKEDNGLEG